jgi:hypothetical protein
MLVSGGAFALAAGHVSPAAAEISPATTVVGPSADIIDIGNIAMAEDGTGGLVFRRRVGGKAHIFVSRFSGGAWSAPQQVDLGQKYDSSWPAIGAGNDGRLVVVWTQPFAANVDRLYFAALDPGARRFQPPHVIDPNIGVAAYTYPALAMSRGGQALLAYRVITDDQPGPTLPAGYVRGHLLLARYSGSYWTMAGAPLERNSDQIQRAPVPGNAPQVGIALDGSGVVAWQEPDDDLFDRIWARRVFPGSITNVLQVSPAQAGTAPLRADADEFALHVSKFGAAAVALRQLPPADGAAFTRARVYLNELPEQFDDKASALVGARPIDGATTDGPEGGPPTAIGISSGGDGAFAATFGLGTASYLVEGTETAAQAPSRLDQGSAIAGDARVARADGGALAAGWKVVQDGAGGVQTLERDADGTPTRRLLSSDVGGDVRDLELGGNDLGDAAVGFLQGDGDAQTINASVIDAPPGAFAVSTPPTWTKAKSITLDWDASPSGVSDVRYSVLLDDQQIADKLTRLSFALTRKAAPDGAHTVKVIATDGAGQTTDSTSADLLVDRTAPKVRIRASRGRATVTVTDGAKSETSGLASGATTVIWGDGRRSSGARKLLHRFRRHGSLRVIVKTADKAGNAVTTTKRVTS